MNKTYLAIDLKSFYASVECVERNLDPLTTNLVVADESRTEKTICLAVSPSLKARGVSGRPRLFEVIQKAEEINRERLSRAPGKQFSGASFIDPELKADPSLELDYIVATPQMAHYMEISAFIYTIYLRYISPDDIHVYSIDEVFIDATPYLKMYGLTASELAYKLVKEVLDATGITATAGIGPNLFLCKVAMDVEAKHIQPDSRGVRIAELDEESFRRKMWNHRPLTDFWRIGPGITKNLERHGMKTLGDVARMSLCHEELLYDLFGVNAELLIDHAWGWEPCTIADIKAYRPDNNSLSSGQVLSEPYDFNKTLLVAKEMAEALAASLQEKKLTAEKIVFTVGFDSCNITNPAIASEYTGPVVIGYYGKTVPKSAHGTRILPLRTSSSRLIRDAAVSIINETVNPMLFSRRLNITAVNVLPEGISSDNSEPEQLSLFSVCMEDQSDSVVPQILEKERNKQDAILDIRKRFGNNSILKGMDLEDGATAIQRNGQVGGHKA